MCKNYAIELYNVSKMYKLFKSKKAKILNLLGFPTKNYEKFWALRDITLKIKRGEKVGFIGRNGAGKTTLLSIIAGNVKPTSGKVIVKGKVNALFTLGTGFHPEFTGRENIISSLAYQGITGKEAQKLMEEIIEFTELEDFIDQPVKTYSAGMYSRLAFAVATAIKPEILIVDEILGVGDAYFNSKALERMNELTSGGTTVLFVSHDLSSIQRICDRVIWIKKGQIQMDGEPLEVIKSYSFEVRKEEELRLKAKNSGVSKKSLSSDLTKEQIIIRFIGEKGDLPREGIAIDKIQLFYRDDIISEIDVGAPMDNDQSSDAYIIVDKEKMNWTEPKKLGDRWVRYVKDIGGSYKHAVAIFNIPRGLEKNFLEFKIVYSSGVPDNILFEYFDNESYRTIGVLDPSKGYWCEKSFKIENLNDKETAGNEVIEEHSIQADIYGSREIEILNVEIYNKNEKVSYILEEGKDFIISIDFKILGELEKKPFLGYTIFDFKGNLITNFYEQIDVIKQGTYKAKIELKGSKMLREGSYIISVAFYKEINEIDTSKPWPVYIVWDRKIEFKVISTIPTQVEKGIVKFDNELYIYRES